MNEALIHIYIYIRERDIYTHTRTHLCCKILKSAAKVWSIFADFPACKKKKIKKCEMEVKEDS